MEFQSDLEPNKIIISKINESQQQKKYVCPLGCNVAFARPSRLEWHMRVHSNERPYKCNFEGCGRSYTRSSHLNRHAQTHENVKVSYKCTECSLTLSTFSNLKRHYSRAHNNDSLVCKECNSTFRKRYRYEEHMALHNKELKYKCDDCGKLFASNFRLNRHKRNHEVKSYICPIKDCFREFNKWATMYKHKINGHSGIDKKCAKCDNRIKKNQLLCKEHKKVDSDKKTIIKCPYLNCERLYYYKRNLDQHIQTVHLDKRYQCDYCKYKLNHKHSLVKHIQIKHLDKDKALDSSVLQDALENQAQKNKIIKRAVRKDAGVPKVSMLSKLSGIEFLPTVERKLMKRNAAIFARDQLMRNDDNQADKII